MPPVRRSWLERRLRRASRTALYGSLLLVTGAAFCLAFLVNQPIRGTEAERWIETDYSRLPEVRLLQRYVQIDTSESSGDEVAGARFLADNLRAAGIEAQIEVLGQRHANLYALLPGRDPRPLVLHNHIDVKDVDPRQWFSPPFEARIQRPWMYGRGVFDMKSVAIAQLLAMVDLGKSGKPLRRSVLFLATGGEETGSWLGARWVVRQHPELVASFWAVLTEGGTVEARTRSDVKYWGTEIGQKNFADLVVCGADRGQLEAVRQELREEGPSETDLRLIPEVRQVLAVYGPSRDSAELRRLLARPEALLGDVALFRQLPDYLRSMLRDQAVPFPVEEAPGGGYQMTVKLQLLPGEKPEDARARLMPSWRTHGFASTLEPTPPGPPSSPVSHPVFQQILATIRADHPDFLAGPFFLPWTATDARFFRAAGVPSYGFSPFLIMNTDTLQVDQANERMALPGYVQGVELYRKVVRRIALEGGPA
ncbi:MAG TPA: M20/M25/M40 family metallo-hydrolase [Thermoanaerobaculia bacterium]|nr:M20/M25/M40 family metallo-hydrolase [Thermoanaerobaculia bacterium]